MTPAPAKRLVIIGGGIGGTTIAKRLANHPGYEITLLDRQNHYQFQPLLYQVATAALGSPDIASPIRFMLRHARNVRVVQSEVTEIDVTRRVVGTSLGPVEYDSLVVAAGVESSYFEHPEWEQFAPPLKTLADATLIRERVLEAYEYAEGINNLQEHARQLTFVVVGGGPTGVELAGALMELAQDALAHDFRRIDPREARVLLIEAGPRLVPMFHATLSESAKSELKKRGIEVRLNAKVTDITERGVYLGEEFVPAANVIWAAGVRSSSLSSSLPAEKDWIGRVKVLPDCSLPGHPEVFVIGDQAHYRPEGKAEELPAVGGVALQQANHVSRLLKGDLKGRARRPFRYFDRGQMATVTRHHALVEVRKFRWSGIIAWWMWLAVHVVFLAGFRNRLTVVLHWGWTYLTLQRGSRLIVRSGRNPPASVERD
jgi:NADH:ubiquinone reductase (H+-translocating)